MKDFTKTIYCNYIQVFVMHELIKLLQRKQLIWHGNETVLDRDFVSSGFEKFDAMLQGGLPKTGVVEINTIIGIGELRLLTPYLQTKSDRLTIFINPPGLVNAESLYSEQIDLSQVIVIHTHTEAEALWAAEQCLKSSACRNVLHWYQSIEVHHVKRLQVAAEIGDCLHVLLRPSQKHALSLPVSLSMTFSAWESGIEVTVVKRKGGWPLAPFQLNMSTRWPALATTSNLANIITFPNVSTF